MTWKEYKLEMENCLIGKSKNPLYQDSHFLEYTKLNISRSKRSEKTSELSTEITSAVKNIKNGFEWMVITEPWCGDAAHICPLIHLIANSNPEIQVSFVLRDTPPLIIDDFLTKGKRAIPILAIMDSNGEVLKTWGPRPNKLQFLIENLIEKGVSDEEKKIAIQQFYNEDKGVEIQKELVQILVELGM